MSTSAPLTDRLLLSLFRRFPANDLIFKEAEARPQGEYDNEAHMGFHHWFGLEPSEMYTGRDVLDLGCGFGGRSIRFADYDTRSVVGVEITEEIIHLASEFAASRGVGHRVTFRHGTGEHIPAPDASFDLITMFDVLEHVENVHETLRECHRVLRPGGMLATVFPPYYSARSGSHLHGYATSVPGLNLIFPTRILKRAATKHLDAQGIDWRSFLIERPTDKLWNMNGVTIRSFNRLVDEVGFRRRSVRYFGDLDHRVPGAYGAGRLGQLRKPPFSSVLGVLPAALPGVREAACSRVVALLER